MDGLTVVWDGTLSKPGGRMLFAPEGSQRQAPETRRSPLYGEVTKALKAHRADMGDRFYSLPEMTALIGEYTTSAVASAVGSLVHNGSMAREHPEHIGGRWAGEQQRYRWIR